MDVNKVFNKVEVDNSDRCRHFLGDNIRLRGTLGGGGGGGVGAINKVVYREAPP